MTRRLDLVGQKFGKLTVIKRVENTKAGKCKYECLCDCGKISYVVSSDLKSEHIKSCKCSWNNPSIKHGYCRRGKVDSVYRVYTNMKDRCYNVLNNKYMSYGGRGITVCDRWLKSFENFLEDMGDKPNNSYSIDRIDVNKNYSPDNCKWSTKVEQARNKRNNVYLTYNNEKLHLLDWAFKLNCSYSTLMYRKQKGWSDEKIITTPIKRKSC